jgi:hypothetical protein
MVYPKIKEWKIEVKEFGLQEKVSKSEIKISKLNLF